MLSGRGDAPAAPICVLILYLCPLILCPHAIYVSSDYICVLILLYMCPQTTIYVSSCNLKEALLREQRQSEGGGAAVWGLPEGSMKALPQHTPEGGAAPAAHPHTGIY
jgi:hypothetical protein